MFLGILPEFLIVRIEQGVQELLDCASKLVQARLGVMEQPAALWKALRKVQVLFSRNLPGGHMVYDLWIRRTAVSELVREMQPSAYKSTGCENREALAGVFSS